MVISCKGGWGSFFSPCVFEERQEFCVAQGRKVTGEEELIWIS